MADDYKRRFIITFTLALLLHLFFFHFFKFNYKIPLPKKQKYIPVEFDIPKKPVKKAKQIVDVPKINNKIPKKAKYVAPNNQKAVKEMKAAAVNTPENSIKKGNQEKEKRKIAKESKIPDNFNFLPSLSAGKVSAQNNIINEKIGNFTFISTVSDIIAPFVILEGRRVMRVLQENISNYTWFYSDINNFKSPVSIKIDFSGSGKVIKIRVLQSSGANKIDWVFYQSVKGGVIPHSPPGGKPLSLFFILDQNSMRVEAE